MQKLLQRRDVMQHTKYLVGKKGLKMHISIRWLKLLICKTQPGDEPWLELTFIFQNIISVLFYILHIESCNGGHFTNFLLSEDCKITSQWVGYIRALMQQMWYLQNKDNKQCLFEWTRDHKGKNMTYLQITWKYLPFPFRSCFTSCFWESASEWTVNIWANTRLLWTPFYWETQQTL